jgi:hypothetical protein
MGFTYLKDSYSQQEGMRFFAGKSRPLCLVTLLKFGSLGCPGDKAGVR